MTHFKMALEWQKSLKGTEGVFHTLHCWNGQTLYEISYQAKNLDFWQQWEIKKSKKLFKKQKKISN